MHATGTTGVALAGLPAAPPAACSTAPAAAAACVSSIATGANIAIAIAASSHSGIVASAAATAGPSGTDLAIAACIAAPAPTTCHTESSDQHRVAQAFVAAAIRLAPVLPERSAYRGRHRRSIAGCPGARLQAVRP